MRKLIIAVSTIACGSVYAGPGWYLTLQNNTNTSIIVGPNGPKNVRRL